MSARPLSDGDFAGIRIQGGLLPADLPSTLAAGFDPTGKVLSANDFHLATGESVRDAANRVWAYLRGVWTGYREALAALPVDAPTASLTRERFLLVLLDQLGYGRVPTTGRGGIDVDGHSFPVSHLWEATPIHLLGWGTPLDTRTKGLAGAAGSSPQSMVQELLNRSDDHLWAMLSNGQVLRLLRDSTSLVGSAYVEFDLEAIFDGDLFADFLLLYTLCQVSRVEIRDDAIGPASCRLEQWRTEAVESGSRALNLLRDGVVDALRTLGSGFLTHPTNTDLRGNLAAGKLSVDDVNHALLRVVYRLLFTFVAEDRDALLDPSATPEARQRYADYFSTARLRTTARRRRGGRYADRWRALTLVWEGLGREQGHPELGLPGLGGLFERGDLDNLLLECELSNEALLAAVRSLSLVREPKSQALRVVDYRNLGAEELGSIYEALLEFVPQWDPATKRYTLDITSGNQRKDTGSYYTPTSLVESLLDTALDPVLDAAVVSADDAQGSVAALLAVTVCDPACGSGHFLVGAARRIAKRVAAIRTGDPEPAPEQVRSAMREVVSSCIYGVDINPLAAELAKVSLWMEALEPGRPLTYLDAQIKVGNALIGATPRLLAEDLPDAAFKPIEGDVKQIATATAKANKSERGNQGSLFDLGASITANTGLGAQLENVIGTQALSLSDVHVQAVRMRAYTDSTEYRRARLLADAWCAAFVWPLHPGAPTPVTQATLIALRAGHDLDARQTEHVARLTAEYRFFHWHLEFPHLFPTTAAPGDAVDEETGWAGGFSVVLGNPPWERVKLQEQEFFAARDPEIATAPNAAARKRLIAHLPENNPALYQSFVAEKRRAEGTSHILRNSGRYPLTGRGDINTYAVFAEADRSLLAGRGRLGVILPTGIATDATTQYFFKDLVTSGSIVSLYDFENSRPLFDGVHRSFKFCLLTLAGRSTHEPRADFAFFAHDPTDLQRPDTCFTLTPDEITLLNPNTGTCPVFRSRRDAEITLGIYRRVPVLINENDPVNGNPWGIKFMRMFDMSNDSHLFHTREQLEADGWVLNGNVFEGHRGGQPERMLPLYEAKMIHHFDHRWATYEPDGTTRLVTADEKADPSFGAIPRYWVAELAVDKKLPRDPRATYFAGYRWISNATNERTLIASRFPRSGVGNSLPIMRTAHQSALLVTMMSTFAVDYVARQKLGGQNMTFGTVEQLPILPPSMFTTIHRWSGSSLDQWTSARTEALDGGLSDSTRKNIRAELDAAFFHMYGINRNDVDYILDTFPIVKRKDEAEFGEYRTKRLILANYDAMAAAMNGDGE
ncbi:N-6 DNA methylase [Gordonia alkaliphila]|uniref:Eco57I restriction-modification methylase domain-containing protein n=1 Tax=Gordonia alkaliphila TaxID=1053547 RepID=UPI001FF663F5|nr:DNA methyltransferase [Gordonia alkaliphila]MCK0439971.1 N-6 DNA methylase [Gordonia alkaliphila]